MPRTYTEYSLGFCSLVPLRSSITPSGAINNLGKDIYKKMRNQFIYNIGLVLSWDGFEQIDEDQKPYYRLVLRVVCSALSLL